MSLPPIKMKHQVILQVEIQVEAAVVEVKAVAVVVEVKAVAVVVEKIMLAKEME